MLRHVAYLGGSAHFALRLKTLAQIHQTLVDLAGLGERSTLRLGVSRSLTARKIDNGEPAAFPRTASPASGALLDLKTEETVTSAGDTVAAGSRHSSFLESGLNHHESFAVRATDYLAQPSDNLPVGRELGGLEKKRPAAKFLGRTRLGGRGQEVVDAVVVHLVHGDDDSILS